MTPEVIRALEAIAAFLVSGVFLGTVIRIAFSLGSLVRGQQQLATDTTALAAALKEQGKDTASALKEQGQQMTDALERYAEKIDKILERHDEQLGTIRNDVTKLEALYGRRTGDRPAPERTMRGDESPK